MTTSTLSLDPTTVAGDALARLQRAWNDADGHAYGAAFTTDASFVTVRGELVIGSEAIGAGHDGIFSSIYAGSVNSMELLEATPVADGVVVAVSINTLDCPTGPLAGRHQARSTLVIVRQDAGGSTWQVAACHNTLVAS